MNIDWCDVLFKATWYLGMDGIPVRLRPELLRSGATVALYVLLGEWTSKLKGKQIRIVKNMRTHTEKGRDKVKSRAGALWYHPRGKGRWGTYAIVWALPTHASFNPLRGFHNTSTTTSTTSISLHPAAFEGRDGNKLIGWLWLTESMNAFVLKSKRRP